MMGPLRRSLSETPRRNTIGIAGGAALISYIATHVKYAIGLKDHPFLGTLLRCNSTTYP